MKTRKGGADMHKRIPLKERCLPQYTRGEEIMNMVTHIAGGGLGILALVLCLLRADTAAEYISTSIYGVSMITLYTISSVYHGLNPNMGKRVMQVIDHCTIYMLIAGTYTPIMLAAFVPVYPIVGWGMLAAQWGLAALAATLTAIDLKKYNVFSMVCYILMGWGIIFFLPQTMAVLGKHGFALLLAGGITYTIGAILYGIGSKKPWFHSIFHIFVVLGSFLQFLAIFLYVL
jgi:hemolysin III